MILKNRLKPFTAFALTAVAISSLSAGCSAVKDAQNAACCSEFVVGQDLVNADFGVDASVKGSFNAYAQATGDLSATATATLGDVLTACQNIALDLGADPADKSLDGQTGTDLTKAWCKLAAAQISADFGAKGTLGGALAVDFTAPVCTASVQATADCEGSCDANANCDVKANPPTCEGGTLSVDCKGSCTAKAGVDLECTGECTGSCTGSCKATGGVKVDCKGKCDGTCSAAAAGGTGTGVQADGSCDGQCDGTCTLAANAPKIKCAGTCDGHCDATCKGSADASVKCNGSCDADFTPLKCEGGTLKASCDVDAHCEASCNASASAKAQCTPPSVSINAEISADADVTAYTAAIDSLKVNLPNLVLAVKGRGELFIKNAGLAVTAGGEIATSGGLNAKGSVCAIDIGIAIVQAVSNMTDAVSAATSVTLAAHI
jgi:hypothetical protein